MHKQSGAIPFIIKDSTKDTYHLTPQAQQFLATIDTPLSVVTVAGLYRTGKSYLLNRVILNRSGGFGVGPTVNPCTKGLWIWAQPIRVSEGRTLLVIDTEGLGALDQQSNHDMKIFCLAVLLSSNFIYNSVGSIDQPALQTLSLVLNLVASIDKESYSSRPSFLWVVRDFSLQLINDKGDNITSRQYLQLALSTQNMKQTQKIQLRKTINQAFSEKQCFTLVKPLIDQNKLQNLDKVPPEQLRAEFISQTIALRKYIFQSLKEVKLNNSLPLKGKDYILMVNRYLNAINCGEMPNLQDTWTFIREEKARQVFEYLREEYTEKLRNKLANRLPMPTLKLNQLLVILRNETIEEFMKVSYDQSPNQELKQFLSNSEVQILKLNSKETKNVFGEVLRREFEPFQKKLLSEYYADSNAFQADLRNSFKNSIIQKFGDRFDLQTTEVQLFAERKITEGLKLFERKSKEQVNRAQQIRMQSQNGLQREIRTMGKQLEEQRRKHQEDIFDIQKKLMMLTNEKQRLEEHHFKQKKQEETQLARVKRRADQDHRILEAMQQQLAQANHAVVEQERTLFVVRKDLQKEKALSSQKEQYMAVKQSQQERKMLVLQQQIQRMTRHYEAQKRDLLNQNDIKLKELSKQTKDLYDNLAQSTAALQSQHLIREKVQQQLIILKNRYADEVLQFKERLNTSNKKDSRRDDNDQAKRQLQYLRDFTAKFQEESKQYELRLKQYTEQIKQLKSSNQKSEAIFTQRVEFQQIQISELRTKNQQLNQSYQRYLDSTHHDSKGYEEMFNRKVADLEAEQQRNIKSLEEDYQKKIKQIKRDISLNSKAKEQIELQLSLEKKKAQTRQFELSQTLRTLEKAYEDVLKRLSYSQQGYAEVAKQKQSYYQSRVKQLQAQVDSIKQKATQQSQQMTKKTQQALAVLKNYSEMERNQWEKRLEEERQKNIRKMRQQQDQFGRKMTEEKQNYDSAINELNEKISTLSQNYSEQIQAIRCDYQIKYQKITNSALQQRMELSKRNALISQQAELTKNNLMSQLDEKTKAYQQAQQSLRRQLTYECEQQVRKARQAADQAGGRLDSLRKANKKTEESNLLLKSQLDKQKALFKEKQQTYSRQLKDLQQKLAQELREHTKDVSTLNSEHTIESRRLNSQIERIRDLLARSDEERGRLQSQHEQQKSSLMTKNAYLQTKLKRSKEDQEDLLKKFESTVRSLSNNTMKADLQREMEQTRKRLRDQYTSKISEKQQSIENQRKQMVQKMMRLQTENKSLRDKLLLLQMRQSTVHNTRYEDSQQLQKIKQLYERKMSEMKQMFQKQRRDHKKTRQQRDALQNSIRMEKSRISDRSERHSFINEPNDNSMYRVLQDNRSLLNRRPMDGTSVKKQQKRYQNAQEFTGIMRWQQQ